MCNKLATLEDTRALLGRKTTLELCCYLFQMDDGCYAVAREGADRVFHMSKHLPDLNAVNKFTGGVF